MGKRARYAWGELRTDSGILLKAGIVDPETRWFVEDVALPEAAVKLTIHWPHTEALVRS